MRTPWLSRWSVGAALLAAACVSVHAEIQLELRSEALLEHAHLTLSDVAVVSAADPVQQKRWSELPLGKAPLAGHMNVLTRSELDLMLRAQPLAPGQTLVWSGADSIRLHGAAQILDIAVLAGVARQELLRVFDAPDVLLEVQVAGPMTDLAVPIGTLEYRAHLVDARHLRSRMAVWVDVIADGTVYRSVLMPLAIHAYRDVFVARRDLPAGTLVSVDDFDLRREDVARLADGAVGMEAVHRGARTRFTLHVGEVATVREMVSGDAVLKGDRVRLQVKGAGVAVETAAYVETDAMVGQRIRVRPVNSSETVVARVLAADIVSMEGR